jgi:hypothetical protein
MHGIRRQQPVSKLFSRASPSAVARVVIFSPCDGHTTRYRVFLRIKMPLHPRPPERKKKSYVLQAVRKIAHAASS